MYRLLLPQTVGAWEGAGSAQGLNIPHVQGKTFRSSDPHVRREGQ